MSDAIAGVGLVFSKLTGTETYTPIANISNITGPGMSRETIDVTTFDSTGGYREFIGGFRNPGTITLTMNFTKTGYQLMKGDFEDEDAQSYKMVFPDTETTTLTFDAIVTELPLTAPTDDKVTCEVTLQITGTVTVA